VEAHFGLGVAYLGSVDRDLALCQCVILKVLDEDLADKLLEMIYLRNS